MLLAYVSSNYRLDFYLWCSYLHSHDFSQVNINKQKKDAFQILKPDLDIDPESNPHFDERMGIDKTKLLRPKRMSFQFVEEGKWSREAEIMKLKVLICFIHLISCATSYRF